MDFKNILQTLSHLSEGAQKKAKPDFLDMDKDGDKKEPMKKAAKDAKKALVGKAIPKKKGTLKDWFDRVDAKYVAEAGQGQNQISIKPTTQKAQVIQVGNKPIASVSDPALAVRMKDAISKGQVNLGGTPVSESDTDKIMDMASKAAKKAGIDPHSMGYTKDKKRIKVKGTYGSGYYDVASGKFIETAQYNEAERPSDDSDMGAGLGAGRSQTTFEGKDEGKPGKNFAKIAKSAGKRYGSKEAGERVAGAVRAKLAKQGKLEEAKPDFLDLDKDGNKKESMKKAAADKKKKKKVDESMNHRISAARLEGKSHGLRGHAHSGKRYEDLEEMKAYHEGYKEGLDECYGQGVYEGVLGTAGGAALGGAGGATLGGIAGGLLGGPVGAVLGAGLGGVAGAGAGAAGGQSLTKGGSAVFEKSLPATVSGMASQEMQEGEDFGAYDYEQLAQAVYNQNPNLRASGGAEELMNVGYELAVKMFGPKVARHSFSYNEDFPSDFASAYSYLQHNSDWSERFIPDEVSEGGDFFTESLERELQKLLSESDAKIDEGLSVTISKGQQGAPDSVSVSAQDGEADQLLGLIKNAGLGLFGDDKASSEYGAPAGSSEVNAPGGIDVVGDHDGMMGIMKKLSGIQQSGDEDYADEEGAEGEEDCGCDSEDCDCGESCSECGGMGMHESSCSSSKEMVDEVESEDQQEFEVAEDNAPDSGEAESTADEDAEAKEDAALAGADSGDEEEINEGEDEELDEFAALALSPVATAVGLGAAGSFIGNKLADKLGEEDELEEGKNFTHQDLIKYADKKFQGWKKSAFKENDGYTTVEYQHPETGTVMHISTSPDDKYWTNWGVGGINKKTGKFFADESGNDGNDQVKDHIKELLAQVNKYMAENSQVNEWANNAGGKGTDEAFERDIEFMTNIISGGLNKRKSTGQTTVPVIASQTERQYSQESTSINESINDWQKLAGIKKL